MIVSGSPVPARRGDRALALEQHGRQTRQRHRHADEPEQPPGWRRLHQRPPAHGAVEAEGGERDQPDERAIVGVGDPAAGASRVPPERRQYRDLRVGGHAARSRTRRPAPTTNPRQPDTSKLASRPGCVASAFGTTRIAARTPALAKPAGSRACRVAATYRTWAERAPGASPGARVSGPALDHRQPGVRDRPRGQIRLDLERAELAGKQQAAAGACPELEHERGGGPDRGVEMLGRTVTAGVDDDQRAGLGVGAQAAARAVRPRARAPANGSATPACPDGRGEGRRPRWRRTARSAPRRSRAATSPPRPAPT